MRRWQSMTGALLCALAGAGCGQAAAEDANGTWEHGVLEWIRFRSATGEQERYSWTTAADETQRDNAAAFVAALGVGGDLRRSASDRVRVLDHLAAAGWLLVNRTDVAYVDAGSSAIAERYILRRQR